MLYFLYSRYFWRTSFLMELHDSHGISFLFISYLYTFVLVKQCSILYSERLMLLRELHINVLFKSVIC